MAVITGAARGLGAALARELSARGATVALLDHDEEELARMARSVPGRAAWWTVDVCDDDAMRLTAAGVAEQLGTASMVVANAGVAEGGLFAESDPDTWRRVIEVNLVGSAVTARTFLPHLLSTQGYYLQIASLSSLGAAPLMSAYGASKAGVESFAHSLQAELAPRHVAVGIAYLNWIDTEMIRSAQEYSVMRELRARMPRPARKAGRSPSVASRLATAAERRERAVYVPRWLRAVQLLRTALPPVVTLVARRKLPQMSAHESLRPTGLLGAGGRWQQSTR